MNLPPTIKTEGRPPERHAGRVVGEICRWLVDEQRRVNRLIIGQIRATRSRLGSPLAQERFIRRLRKAANGKGIVELRLTPGKRGKFKIMWASWRVVNPITADTLDRDMPIPERPWLACELAFIEGAMFRANNDDEDDGFESYRVFVLTHHAMQRLAERCNARTPDDLLDALQEIWRGMNAKICSIRNELEEVAATKGLIWRVPVAGGVAILEKTEDIGFVVKTVLDEGME